jgi:hypothetical protein
MVLKNPELGPTTTGAELLAKRKALYPQSIGLPVPWIFRQVAGILGRNDSRHAQKRER